MNRDFRTLKRKVIKVFFVLCAVLAFTTCQSIEAVFRQPAVALHSVNLAGINFTGVQLLAKLQVDNPNAFDIPLPEIGWELFVNANSFISGIVRNNERIRGQNTTLIDVPVNLDFVEIFKSFSSLLGRSQSDYKIALAVKFPIPILGDLTWNFAHEGDIPILQMPKLTMPTMRIDRVDLTGVDFVVSLNLENPNIFELPAPKIAFDYLVNRNSFIKNTVETRPLAASSITPVDFRMSVKYTELFSTFQNLNLLGEASGLLNLTCDFAIPAFENEIMNVQIPGTIPLLGRL